MSDTFIKDSFKNIKDTTIIFNDKKLIEENKELKSILEILFGKDYKAFLEEQQKNNTQLMLHLYELLNKKNIFETIELLQQEQEKREKLFNELEEIKYNTKEDNFKFILEKAEEALIKYNYEEYHQILEDYDEKAYKKRNLESARINILRAREFLSRFKYLESIKCCERAIERDKGNYLYISYLANIYHNKGDYDNSIKYYNKALKHIDAQHHDTSSFYNNIGLSYNLKGDNVNALKYFEDALEIALKNKGKKNIDTASNYNNIGLIYDVNRDYDKAIEYHNISLSIDLDILGKFHYKTARDYNNIGNTYEHKGEYKKAIKYLKIALEINLKTITENHPDTATNYNNLGNAYNHQENYSKAIKYYTKALEIDLKTIGKEHPSTAIDYANLGSIYANQEQYTTAIMYFQSALNIYSKSFGKNHAYATDIEKILKHLQLKTLKVFSNS